MLLVMVFKTSRQRSMEDKQMNLQFGFGIFIIMVSSSPWQLFWIIAYILELKAVKKKTMILLCLCWLYWLRIGESQVCVHSRIKGCQKENDDSEKAAKEEKDNSDMFFMILYSIYFPMFNWFWNVQGHSIMVSPSRDNIMIF